MPQVLSFLANTPIPTILVAAGITFFFFGMGGQLGAKIITDKIRPKAAYTVGVILLISGIYVQPPGQTDDDRTFNNPTLNGQPIDFCYHWGTDCGSRTANAFCHTNKFEKAKAFGERWNVPSTYIVGDGTKCPSKENQKCATFYYITCAKE